MSCKYNWYNLPKEIKKQIAEPLKEIISSENYTTIKKINWFNTPNKLNTIFINLVAEYLICAEEVYTISKSEFEWYDLINKLEVLCDLRDSIILCNQVPESTLTAFNISTDKILDYCNPVFTEINRVVYHNGMNILPTIGDICYLDAVGNDLLSSGEYTYLDGVSLSVLFIGNEGIVIESPGCL